MPMSLPKGVGRIGTLPFFPLAFELRLGPANPIELAEFFSAGIIISLFRTLKSQNFSHKSFVAASCAIWRAWHHGCVGKFLLGGTICESNYGLHSSAVESKGK